MAQLKPVFAYSTGGKFAGLEATPLFHDGTLYFTGDYARVFALDARTGTVSWYWEPKYEEGIEAILCCGPVNRGLAIHGDNVFVGTLDARLVALNTKDGSVAWEQKIEDWKNAYASTGAPLVVGDLVITGIAGAEYGVRGFVQAFKAATGEPVWKTFMIPAPASRATRPGPARPGRPAAPPPGRRAPTTPRPDAALGHRQSRPLELGPAQGRQQVELLAGGDRCRHRQDQMGVPIRPNDAWDYDGNNAPVLMDVTIDGTPRKVAVQANRNGFLYVLDRVTGEFIYATPTIEGINWTTGLDPKTGRADRQRGTAAEERRRQDRADRAGPRGRHQLVPDRGQSREGHRLSQHQRLGDVAEGLEARRRRLQGRLGLHGRRLSDVPAQG